MDFVLRIEGVAKERGGDGLTVAGNIPVSAAVGLPTLVSLPTFGTDGERS